MALPYTHLISLTDDRGIFEHAEFRKPRHEHGYCVDDVARALIIIERNQPSERAVYELRHTYFHFLRNAQSPDGKFINRCDVNGQWNGVPEITDHWGRGLWALGTVYKHDKDQLLSVEALWRFEHGARHRSQFLRSMIFAGLGAAAVLSTNPKIESAQSLLHDAVALINETSLQQTDKPAHWIWPEKKLTYANAIIPEVLIYAGDLLNKPSLVDQGLELLDWLINKESTSTHFSVTPTSGDSFNLERDIFDQQAIELAAIVDACSTAFEVTGDTKWLAHIARAARWFYGSNDSSVMMHDPETGAGFDGLTATGRNENCGAESTICYLSVLDQYQRYFGVRE